MADAGIVRNRLKIEATIANAKAYLELSKRCSLSDFLWGVRGWPADHQCARELRGRARADGAVGQDLERH